MVLCMTVDRIDYIRGNISMALIVDKKMRENRLRWFGHVIRRCGIGSSKNDNEIIHWRIKEKNTKRR